MGSFTAAPPQSAGMGQLASPSQLAGPSPSEPGQTPDPSTSPAGNNSMSAVVGQIHGMEQGLKGMSQAFPASSPEIRAAITALRNVLTRIVSSPAQAEPAAPSILG